MAIIDDEFVGGIKPGIPSFEDISKQVEDIKAYIGEEEIDAFKESLKQGYRGAVTPFGMPYPEAPLKKQLEVFEDTKPEADSATSWFKPLQNYGEQVLQAAKDTVDQLLESKHPSLLEKKGIGTQAFDHLVQDFVSENFREPLPGWFDLNLSALKDPEGIKTITGVKILYPFMPLNDAITMGASIWKIQKVRGESGSWGFVGTEDTDKKHILGFNTGLNPQASFYWTHMTLEVVRTNLTLAKISKFLQPYAEHEKLMRTGLLNPKEPSKKDKVGMVRHKRIMAWHDSMKAIVKAFRKAHAIQDPREAINKLGVRNVFVHQLPTEYYRYEVAIKIAGFPLYLRELVSYKETYTYPWHEVKSLTSSHIYSGGGRTQQVHFKAKFFSKWRSYFDYFIRLANTMRPLRFVVSFDDQVRRILITSITANYTHWSYRETIYENPIPQIAEFDIHAIVLGAPLPMWNQDKRLKEDPTLSYTEGKDLEQKDLFNRKEAEGLLKAPPPKLTIQEAGFGFS